MYDPMTAYVALLVCVVLSAITMVILRAYVYVDMAIERSWISSVVDKTDDVITHTTTKEECMVEEDMVVRGMTMYGTSAGIDWRLCGHHGTAVAELVAMAEDVMLQVEQYLGYMYVPPQKVYVRNTHKTYTSYLVFPYEVVENGGAYCDMMAEFIATRAASLTMEDIHSIELTTPAYMRRNPVGKSKPVFSPMYSKHITRTVVDHNINTMAKVA